MDPHLQRGATAPGFALSKPGGVPLRESALDGLKSGKHDRPTPCPTWNADLPASSSEAASDARPRCSVEATPRSTGKMPHLTRWGETVSFVR